jgi:glycosyltransferase involved in cell wall biosynthesis
VGPLGGGETSPRALRDGFGFKSKVIETLRDISTATITMNPMVRGGLTRAAMIAVRTTETYQVLIPSMQRRSIIFGELTLDAGDIGEPREAPNHAPRLLYAGRLLYWKGVHLAIRAFAEFSRRMPDARLTVVGKGPEEPRLRADAAAYHVENKVDFISWLPQEKLFDLYSNHDLLVFPSLHDSGGTVILEALSRGLPVMCLDLGGPRYLVTPSCGIIIGTSGRNTAQVTGVMAQELVELFSSRTRLAEFSAGAIARAKEFILPARVGWFYENAMSFVAQSEIKKPQGHCSTLATAKR